LTAGFAVIGGVSAPDGASAYAPNDIIVKFRSAVADSLEWQLELKKPPGGLRLSARLDELNVRYGVREVKAVFKDFKKHRRRMEALATKDTRLLTKKERHLLGRLKRAPKGAKVPDLSRIYKLELDLQPGQSVEEVLAAYNADPDVEYAELNYMVSTNLTPNDPLYGEQWALNKIDASIAWDLETGSPEVVVAVVDTGVDYRHRDLQANMWMNPGERANNGVDDDGNGYVDDIYGYDFCTYGGKLRDSDPLDDDGHGTHCAGIIAAKGNNRLDITGVCWRAQIMGLKFLDSTGTGWVADAVAAFYYAVENGANVTSNSWGGGGYCRCMEEAIDYAYSQGVIMVAAAGNSNSSAPFYPAFYDHMISVAATGPSDERASFSNYGDWVDLAAPGVDILSLRASGTSMGTIYNDYTTIASGTSMACPHVAGVYALVLSAQPEWSTELVIGHVVNTADDLGVGYLGSGRVNAYRAVTMPPGVELVYKDYVFDDSPGDNDGRVDPNERFYLDVKIKSNWGPASGVWAYLSSDSPWVRVTDSNAFYGAMSPQEQKSALEPFVIEASPNCPVQSIIPFTVTIYADGGYVQDYSFDVYQRTEWLHDVYFGGGDDPKTKKVVVDRQGIVYVCTGTGCMHMAPDERDGIYRGIRDVNGTMTWQHLGPTNGLPSVYVAFDCAVGGEGEIWSVVGYYNLYKSSDYGQHWSKVGPMPPDFRAWPDSKIICDPCEPNKLYAFWKWGQPRYGKLYEFSAATRTWQLLHEFQYPANDFAIDPQDPNVFHACGFANEVPYYFKSADAGISWSYTALPFIGKAYLIRPVGDNKIYMRIGEYHYGIGRVCKSTNGGYSWTLLGECGAYQSLHVDLRDSEILYDCRDDGPYKSFDGGRSFVLIRFGSYPRYALTTVQERFYPYRLYMSCTHTGVYSCDTKHEVAEPAIEAVPYEVHFHALMDGPDPDDRVLAIRNSGAGTLVWEIVGDCPWLEVSNRNGDSSGEADEVIFSADISGLGPGHYQCPLTIWADDALENRRIMNVVLHVQGPVLELDANDLDLLVGKERPAAPSETWSITNAGGGTLNWGISVLNSCSWLDVNPLTGRCTAGESNEVTLRVDTNGLNYGSYSCELAVYGWHAEQSPQYVQITLQVAPPRLAIEPSVVGFWACDELPNPPAEILSIRNTGFDTLNWQITKPNDCDWLEVFPLTGESTGEVDEVVLWISESGPPAGQYNCALMVSAADAENSPQAIAVELVVNTTLHVPTVDYPTIQAAIDAAIDEDVVVIADGTYSGQGNRDIDFKGKAITVRSANGAEDCIIDCQGTAAEPHRGFYFHSGEGPDSVVDGFTITNGYADSGGGILNENSSPTVINCFLGQNVAVWEGGGMENIESSAAVKNCVFSGNATLFGLGFGGGVDNYYSSPVITNCTFQGNSAYAGGGLYNSESTGARVSNCILWGNIAPDWPQIYGDCTVSYSDVEGGYSGADNIDADPCFVDAAGGDYHLLPGSPVIDAGDPASDCSNEPWPNGGRVNMGTYGNTSEATRSGADFEDLAVLASYWLTDEPLVDIAPAPDGDGIANFLDFGVFADYWL
jgi:subtilisin family serine protease